MQWVILFIVTLSIVHIRLYVKTKKEVITGRSYHVRMDYSNEDLNDTYFSQDQIKSLPRLMVESMDLVIAMPIPLLEFLGKQTLGRNRMTKWIHVNKKCDRCLKKSINTHYSMQT